MSRLIHITLDASLDPRSCQTPYIQAAFATRDNIPMDDVLVEYDDNAERIRVVSSQPWVMVIQADDDYYSFWNCVDGSHFRFVM